MAAVKYSLIGDLVHVVGEQKAALETLMDRIEAGGEAPDAVAALLERSLLRAVEAQHRALDIAFTLVCMRNPEFRPSKSPEWTAVEHGNKLMVAVRRDLGETVDDR